LCYTDIRKRGLPFSSLGDLFLSINPTNWRLCMKFFTLRKSPPPISGVVLQWKERDHQYFKEYMMIRDFHYHHKNQWEEREGVDQYDPHSIFVLVVESRHVVAGCRIINDDIGLPVREVLRNNGLPTEQIPLGSCEISRFVIHPAHLARKETGDYVSYLADAIKLYCSENRIFSAYAVMISILEKWMDRLGIPVFPLSQPAVISHGSETFRTVRFPS